MQCMHACMHACMRVLHARIACRYGMHILHADTACISCKYCMQVLHARIACMHCMQGFCVCMRRESPAQQQPNLRFKTLLYFCFLLPQCMQTDTESCIYTSVHAGTDTELPVHLKVMRHLKQQIQKKNTGEGNQPTHAGVYTHLSL